MPSSQPAVAAAGINKTINFQGRLLSNTGAVVADGNYNMRFVIYQGGTGTASTNGGVGKMWTEEYKNVLSEGVVVKNGYYSVALGTYCAFDGSACSGGQSQTNTPMDWNQDTLWLSMDVDSAGTTPGGVFTYNGELLPMRRMASAVYALQAGSCTSCVLQAPSSTAQNTIAPTGANTTGLIVQQTSTASPTADIFDVYGTSSATKFIQVTATAANAGAISVTTQGASALTLTAGAASTWSTTSGLLTLQGAGGVTVDAAASQTIAIGGSNAIHTIQIGAGATGTNAITIGTTNSTSSTTIQGGTTANTAISLVTNGAGGITVDSGGAGAVNLGNTHATTVQLGNNSSATTVTGSTVSLTGTSTVTGTNAFTVNGGLSTLNGLAAGGSEALLAKTNAATNVGTIIQGAAGQTADLLQLQDSTAANLFRVDSNGNAEKLGYLDNGYGGIGSFANLVTFSEQFDNAAWVKTSASATADQTAAPDGQTTADTVHATGSGGKLTQAYASAGNNTYTYSVWLKTAASTQNVDLRIDSNGTPATGTTPATVKATTTWQRFSVTQTFTSGVTTVTTSLFPGTTGGVDSQTVYAWGAQLVQASVPQVYARTTTATVAVNQGVVSNGGEYISSLNAADVPLIVRSAVSQVANLLTIQDASAAPVTLFGISSTGAITAPTATNTINNLVVNNGSLTNVGNITGAGAVTVASNGAAALNLTGGAASTWSLGSGNALTVTSSMFNLSSTGALTLGSAAQSGTLLLQDGGGHTATIQNTGALAGNIIYNLPTNATTPQTICTSVAASCSGTYLTAAGSVLQSPTSTQTINPAANNAIGLIVQQSTSASNPDVFDVVGSGGVGNNFIQVTSTAANAGAVKISSLGANALTLQSGSGVLTVGATTTGIDFSDISAATSLGYTGASVGAGNTLTISGQAGAASSNGGQLTLQGGAAGATTGAGGLVQLLGGAPGNAAGTNGGVTIDTGNLAGAAAGTIAIGNTAFAHTIQVGTAAAIQGITIGSTTTTSSTLIEGGATAGVSIGIGNGATAHVIKVGTAAAVQGITIGSATTTSATTIEGGASGSVGTPSIAIGNGATAHYIDIGTAAAIQGISIGSTTTTSTTLIEGGATAGVSIGIGNGATAHVIQIGTGGAVQGITIGSLTTTSTTIMQGGTTANTAVKLTTSGTGGITVDTGGAGTVNVANANATAINIGGNSGAILTEKVANTSATAFQLQTAGGTTYLTADTSNKRVVIAKGSAGETSGTAAVPLVVDSSDTAPTAVNGGMYYNSANSSFQCGQNGNWQECTGLVNSITTPSAWIDGNLTSGVYTEFTGTGSQWTAPAGDCQTGVVYKMIIGGTYNNIASWGFHVSIMDNGSNVAASGSATPAVTSEQNEDWLMNATITCDSSTTAVLRGSISFDNNNNGSVTLMIGTPGASPIAWSSGSNTIGVGWDWNSHYSVGTGDNTARIDTFVIDREGP